MNRIVTSSEALSDRERAVAERFAAGMTYREIGQGSFHSAVHGAHAFGGDL
ncbi:hypothetical protein ACVOMV_18300 [Mesorhizobium atlanticum]